MSPEDLQQVIALAAARKWLPLVALLIWALVRISKQDVDWFKWPVPFILKYPFRWVGVPVNIPPGSLLRIDWLDTPKRARPVLPIALGLLAGVVEKAATGLTWRLAIAQGVTAGITAMVGHNLVVDAARGGRDIGAKPAPKDPDTMPETPFAKSNPPPSRTTDSNLFLPPRPDNEEP